jgi:hypothetical protein
VTYHDCSPRVSRDIRRIDFDTSYSSEWNWLCMPEDKVEKGDVYL